MGPVAGHETILLVEDEDAVRFLAKRMLERAGYRVLQARHGEEALSVCERHEGDVHLILSDVVMPQMGGRELVEKLLGSHPEMRAVLMSGYADGQFHELGKAMAQATFLRKPFSYQELTATVRAALDEPS